MKQYGFILLMCSLAAVAQAESAKNQFFIFDYSGVYDCKGNDAHEGAYTGTVKMKRIPEHQLGRYQSYEFTLQVPDYGTYQGHAVAQGSFVAVHFALPMQAGKYGGKHQDFGTGIAQFSKAKDRWTFKKFYYEPLYKGGNTGTETCVQRKQ